MNIVNKKKTSQQQLHKAPFLGTGNYRTAKWVGNKYKIRVQSIPVFVNGNVLYIHQNHS
jgi:hypothetical protein